MLPKVVIFWKRFVGQMARQRAGCVAGAIIAVLFGLILLWLPLAHPLSTWSYDLPFNHSPKNLNIPDEAVIVYMDEQSHVALDQPTHGAWDRALHANLLRRLTEAGARAVVFDVVFFGPGSDPAADEQLASAIREQGNVILAGEVVHYKEFGTPVEQILAPHEPFRRAAAGWGLVDLAIDKRRAVRRHLHDPAMELPSLSWAVAEELGAEGTRAPAARESSRWFRYYGPPGTLPSASFHQALHSDGVAPDFFRDRVVFVGAKPTTGFTGTGMDEFATPYLPWALAIGAKANDRSLPPVFAPGVEVHATSFLNLLHDDWLRQVPQWSELAWVVALGLVLGVLLVPFRPATATGIALGAAVAIAVTAWLLFWHQNLWFAWLIPVGQVGVALGWSVLYNSVQWYVERKLLAQTLSLHLSPARAKVVMNEPELLRPGAELQTISILFSDIANFTGIAEKTPPDDLAKLLNEYFETSISSIHATDGTVVKLIGDAIFAIWNAPALQADHHLRACQAALLLRDQLVDFGLARKSLPQLRTRVGLHSGTACVGNFGSSTRFDYTAIGDSVNLAARLEGLNKILDTHVLMTGEVLNEVRGRFASRRLGDFVFKGFERAVEVHELIGSPEDETSTRNWRATFERALGAYQKRDFDAANRSFRETLEQSPNDGPTLFYLRQIEELQARPPDPEWRGEVVLTEK